MRARSVIPLVLSVLAAVTGPAFLPAHAGNAHAATDVVDYECTGTGVGPQNVQIRVTLTMPENPVAGQEMVIGWQGVYQAGAVPRTPGSPRTASCTSTPPSAVSPA